MSDAVLIVGSGGREHALGWKLSQSPRIRKIYHAPGNGGTSENVDVRHNDVEELVLLGERLGRDCLTVIGPEESLSLGVVDTFARKNLRIFGPTARAAMLESSKVFAKEFMKSASIPTARFATFSDVGKAKDYIKGQEGQLVIKADGLAAGKGVIVCESVAESLEAIEKIMIRKEFGVAGESVVIEERLTGEEASFIALCDGKTIMPLASSQDHKRIFDGDEGPNTGGMGAYSPAPVVDDVLHDKIVRRIMEPAIRKMHERGTPFVGFLYAGIMVDEETGEPSVLEFNARMGDPECQPIVMRMKSDLFEYMDAAVDGRLGSMPPLEWHDQAAVCVVMASRGYPGTYKKGEIIEGLDSDFGSNTVIFHAGTAKDIHGNIVTAGGRVLGVTSLGSNAKDARDNAYLAVRRIKWGENGQYYRTDIARRAITKST